MTPLSGTRIKIVASTDVELTKPLVGGNAPSLGMAITQRFEDSIVAMAASAEIGAGKSISTYLGGGIVGSEDGAPVHQKDTATAAGTITTAGIAKVTITGAYVPGSPLVVTFAVAESDTAAVWAGKARAALALETALVAEYTVGGTSTAISLEDRKGRGNDATLNLALADDTSAGITEAATSANTVTGVAGVVILGGDGKDLEGGEISPSSYLNLLILRNHGPGTVYLEGPAINTAGLGEGRLEFPAGRTVAIFGDTTNDFVVGSAMELSAVAYTNFDILFYGS